MSPRWRSSHTRSEIARGSAAPSVITYTSRAIGPEVFEGNSNPGDLTVQRRRNDGHPVDIADIGELGMLLLAPDDVNLQRRITQLHQMPERPVTPRVTGEVPMHDVPPARAQLEIDGRRVHHNPITNSNRPRELRDHICVLGLSTQINEHTLQPRPLRKHLHDVTRTKRRHGGTLVSESEEGRSAEGPGGDIGGWGTQRSEGVRYRKALRTRTIQGAQGQSHNDAMSRSTRSSRDLNGSLHNTVRCAWSLSFRCTQSTV